MNWFRKSGPVLALTVAGLRCAHCEATVKIALGSLAGVRSVWASNSSKTKKATSTTGNLSVEASQVSSILSYHKSRPTNRYHFIETAIIFFGKDLGWIQVKNKKCPSLGTFRLKISKNSHKTYLKCRTPERIEFSREFCPTGFTSIRPRRE